jgi:hypothetical protein
VTGVRASAHRGALIGCIAVLSAATAGCATSPHRNDVSSAAVAFVKALTAHDGGRACQLLTPNAQQSVSGATDTSCEEAILQVKDDDTTIVGVQVWGDAAQVSVGGDVLFLRRLSGSWRISAAGCDPQPKGPYECKVTS